MILFKILKKFLLLFLANKIGIIVFDILDR